MNRNMPVNSSEGKRKHRKWPFVLLLIVTLITIIAIANGGSNTPSVANDTHTVEYRVDGAKQALSISYNTDGSATINQEQNVNLPWSRTLTIQQAFAALTVNAQNAGSGTIVVHILVDGNEVKNATATGEYGMASASASIS